jgi:hypothetical protein
MRRKFLSLAFLFCATLHLFAQGNQPGSAQRARLDAKWAALVGEWTGEGTGQPGNGMGTSSFQFDLQKQVLVRRSHSEYPPAGGRPATIHDDLMVIYPGAGGESRAIYFDNEGHVIDYTATWSAGGDTLTLLSKPTPGAPQFRLTYKKVDPETLTVAFEMAPPGQAGAFKPYVAGKLKRKEN